MVSNIVFFHPEPWGNNPIWRILFKGLKPPTSSLKQTGRPWKWMIGRPVSFLSFGPFSGAFAVSFREGKDLDFTPLKFNMSPLKSYLAPIGKACLPTTIFQERTVKLWEGRWFNLVDMGAKSQSRIIPSCSIQGRRFKKKNTDKLPSPLNTRKNEHSEQTDGTGTWWFSSLKSL